MGREQKRRGKAKRQRVQGRQRALHWQQPQVRALGKSKRKKEKRKLYQSAVWGDNRQVSFRQKGTADASCAAMFM